MRLADVDVPALNRRNGMGVLPVLRQGNEGQGLIALLLKYSEKSKWRCGKELVDCHLNVGSHMSRELAIG